MTTQKAIQILISYAEGRIGHINSGLCPDSFEGYGSRDDDCVVCKALDTIQNNVLEM